MGGIHVHSDFAAPVHIDICLAAAGGRAVETLAQTLSCSLNVYSLRLDIQEIDLSRALIEQRFLHGSVLRLECTSLNAPPHRQVLPTAWSPHALLQYVPVLRNVGERNQERQPSIPGSIHPVWVFPGRMSTWTPHSLAN